MPYADPEVQRSYMRQKMRERRAAAKAQGIPAVYPSFRPSQENMRPAVIPEIAGLVIPDVRPAPGNVSPGNVSPRQQLLRDYQGFRQRGLSETEAKRKLQRQHSDWRRQADQQRQESQLQVRALLLMGEARRRLSRGGFYNEADVWPSALALARTQMRMRQQPRQADAEPERLAAPAPFRLA